MIRIQTPRNGKVHVGHRIERFPTHCALECTGRAVQNCLPTEAPVTCGVCLHRFASDPALLGLPHPLADDVPESPPAWSRPASHEALLHAWSKLPNPPTGEL